MRSPHYLTDLLVVVLALILAVAGCVPVTPAAQPGRTVTVMTHDSFSVSEEVVAKFQAQCNCQVRFLKSGDAGLALNKAILSKANPLADVFYGVDNSFLSRALAADIFEPYASPALAGIPADLKQDASNRLLPVDFGYVALNYDKKYFAEKKLPLPQTLADLTKPAYRGLLAVENPATSSPGLAFLLTTVTVFGEQGGYTYLDFWRDAAGKRGAGGRWLGGRLLRPVQRRQRQGRSAPGGQLCHQPGRRGLLCRPATGRIAQRVTSCLRAKLTGRSSSSASCREPGNAIWRGSG